MSAEVDGGDLVTVQLIDLPVPLHMRATEHAEGLRREFRLLEEYANRERASSVPSRLLELTQALRSSYGGFTTAQEDALEEAAATGRDRLTLEFRVPPHAADAARTLGAMLEEADEFCREGQHLLTLASPDDVVEYRRWYLRQFIDQIGGTPPVPWPRQQG